MIGVRLLQALLSKRMKYNRGRVGANSCSSEFGYAQACSCRIMLKKYDAYVCLIDEFRTSPCCSISSSHRLLKAAVASGYERRGVYQHRLKLHGVRYCDNCFTDKGCKKFSNTDFNAAINILSCYTSVALGHKRPDDVDSAFKTSKSSKPFSKKEFKDQPEWSLSHLLHGVLFRRCVGNFYTIFTPPLL